MREPPALFALFCTVNERSTRSAVYGSAALLAMMLVIVLCQIIFRSGFNASLSWTEEVSRTLMVWGALAAAPWAYRHSAHVSIDLFSSSFSPRFTAAVQLVIHTLVAWIAGVFLLQSLSLITRSMTSRAATLDIPVGLFYVILPLALGLMILVAMEHLIRNCFALAGHPLAPPAQAATAERL